MTIAPESDLFKAILSMDSYNRSYNQGIDVSGTSIGTATILTDSESLGSALDENGNAKLDGEGNQIREDVDKGFYAIAYQLPDESVTIAYRGTDQLETNTNNDGIGGDRPNAYDIALGHTDTTQGLDAFRFLNDVEAQLAPEDPDPFYSTDITVTGHSLGGGLAGLVGQVYGLDGVVFDNMPFNSAANNTYELSQSDPTSSVVTTVYDDPANALDPDASGLSGYYLDGDFLEAIRIDQNPDPEELSPGDGVDISASGFFAGHTMASLIITMYGSDENYVSEQAWKTHAANYLWAGLFDESFAEKVGLTNTDDSTVTNPISGRYIDSNDYANALQSIIAYSVIDDGTRVFGDTAIKAFFHDANALGRVLNAYYQNEQADPQNDAKIPDSDSGGLDHLSSNLMRQIGSATAQNGSPISYHYAASSLTDAIVEYAAELGVAKVLQSQHSTAVNGILTFSDTAADTNAHTPANHSLAVNFSDALWGLTDMPQVTDGSHAPYIAARTEMFTSVMAQTDVIASTDEALVKADMTTYWENQTADAIKQVVYAVDAAGGVVQMPTDVADGITSKVSMFVGSKDTPTAGFDGNDTIIGTTGNDLVLGSGGHDTYVISPGTGPDGSRGVVQAVEHVSSGNASDIVIQVAYPNNGGEHYAILDSVETVVAKDYYTDNMVSYTGGAETDTYTFTKVTAADIADPQTQIQQNVADIASQVETDLQAGTNLVTKAFVFTDSEHQLADTTYINFNRIDGGAEKDLIETGSIDGSIYNGGGGKDTVDYSMSHPH